MANMNYYGSIMFLEMVFFASFKLILYKIIIMPWMLFKLMAKAI